MPVDPCSTDPFHCNCIQGLDLDTLKKPMKLHVLERKSGRILSGNEGPTEANLETWLKEHPTFQVIRPKVKTKLPSPYLLKLRKYFKNCFSKFFISFL